MSHDRFSPWPQHGKWIRAECPKAWSITTSYGGSWPWWARLFGKRFKSKLQWCPFLSWKFGNGWHGYIGFRPITLEDRGFWVPKGFNRNIPAREFGKRIFGWGEIS